MLKKILIDCGDTKCTVIYEATVPRDIIYKNPHASINGIMREFQPMTYSIETMGATVDRAIANAKRHINELLKNNPQALDYKMVSLL